jgi:hypothetical protein
MAKTLLNYGILGTFKSTQLGLIANWLYSEFGGVVRMLTADSGLGPVREYIDAGIIHHINLNSCQYPVAVVKRVSKGYWPKRIDLATGKIDEATLALTTEAEWQGVSGYLIEGITRIAELYKIDSERKGRSIGEPLQGSDKAAVQAELGEQYLGASRGTYMGAQGLTADYVERFKGLPVPWVVYTGHESKGEDENDRPCYGPAVLGKALNSVVGGWFENTLHSQQFHYDKKDSKGNTIRKTGVKLFFTSHPDATFPKMTWPAKLGVSPRIQAQVEAKWPGGYVPLLMDASGEYVSSIVDLLNVIDPPPSQTVPAKDEAAAEQTDLQEVSDTGTEIEEEGGEGNNDENGTEGNA